MTSIFVKDVCASNPYETSIEDLYNYLNNDLKNPKTRYEYMNIKENPYVKPHLDIDIKNRSKIDINDIKLISDISNILKEIFDNDIDIIYKTNHRNIKIDKTNRIKKKSYHIIISNRKIKMKDLKYLISNNLNRLNKCIDKKYLKDKNGVDLSIYREGINSLRLPLTIKESSIENPNRNNKGFIMNLENNINNFKKYLISKTDDLQEIIVDNKEEEKEEKKELTEEEQECAFDKNIRYIFGKLNKNRLNKILEGYEVTNIKKNINKPYIELINIKKIECPFVEREHKRNNQYLVLNYLTNEIILKCNKCINERKVILEDVFLRLREFSLDSFRKIENYNYMKTYLEKRVLYMNDINVYKKICYDRYNNKHLQTIKFDGIGKSIFKYMSFDKEGNEVLIEKPFKLKYEIDKNAKSYSNTIFYPDKNYNNPNYYNEFEGLAYENILPFYEDKEMIYQKYQTKLRDYIDFLLRYFCDNDKKVLDYFLSLLSFYIQYPYELNHIILVLYSNIQGTGKSSFLDFFTSIIGATYSISCDIDKVINPHSNVAYKKIINIVEELEYSSKNNYAKILKNKCQELQSILNEKNEPMRKIDNFVHYILTTNDIKSLPLPVTDRRHFILEVKKIFDNDKLIDMIDTLYKDDYFIYTFGRFLKERKANFNYLSVLKWEKLKPITNAFNLMIKRDTIDSFIMKLLTLKDVDLKRFDNEYMTNFNIEYDDITIDTISLYECYKYILSGSSFTTNKYLSRKELFIKQIVDIRKYFVRKKNTNLLIFDYDRTIRQLKIDNKYKRTLFNIIPIIKEKLGYDDELVKEIEVFRNRF